MDKPVKQNLNIFIYFLVHDKFNQTHKIKNFVYISFLKKVVIYIYIFIITQVSCDGYAPTIMLDVDLDL